MRLVPVEELKVGMKLGRAIFSDEDGKVLLRSNVELKTAYIKRIEELNYEYVYILEPGDEENKLSLYEPVREETLFKARSLIREVFLQLKQDQPLNYNHLRATIAEMVDEILADPNVVYNMIDLRTHDSYTYAHSVNVCLISMMIGAAMGLNRKQLEILGIGALMHDVGKIMVDTNLLNKPDRLDHNESEQMRQHAREGYELLKRKTNLNFLSAHVAFQHHESEDGSGYPRGLTGRRIHRFAKIVAVADAYDAMTSNRAYHKEIPIAQALDELKQEATKKFDPRVIETLLRIIVPFPVGSTLELSNGETVKVLKATRYECLVQVTAGQREGESFNLLNHASLKVLKCFAQ